MQEWCFEFNVPKMGCDHCALDAQKLAQARLAAERQARIGAAANPYAGMNRRDRRRAQAIARKKKS